VDQTKERVRDAWGAGALEGLTQDVRYGLRSLRQTPAFTVAVVLTLALGIGANTAIFSVVNGVLLRPLPYGEPERLVVLRQTLAQPATPSLGFSEKELLDYRAASKTLEGLVEYHTMSFTLLGGAEAQRVQTGVVSPDFFDFLGVAPLLGRNFRAEDDLPGADAVLMLSYDYWQRRHGGDPSVVGKVFQMNNRPHTVVGVLPNVPQFPNENDVYMPSSACPFRSSAQTRENRAGRMLSVYGRLRPGMTLQQAKADLASVAGGPRRRPRGLLPEGLGLHDHGRGPRRRADAARAADAPGAAGRRRLRAADRLRQRRQPDAVAHAAARPRARDARGARRGAGAARAPAAHREHAARHHRRRDRPGAGGGRPRPAGGLHRAIHHARERGRHRRDGARLHARRLGADRHAVRRAAGAHGAARDRGGDEGENSRAGGGFGQRRRAACWSSRRSRSPSCC
jgi:hypothetical protein